MDSREKPERTQEEAVRDFDAALRERLATGGLTPRVAGHLEREPETAEDDRAEQ